MDKENLRAYVSIAYKDFSYKEIIDIEVVIGPKEKRFEIMKLSGSPALTKECELKFFEE